MLIVLKNNLKRNQFCAQETERTQVIEYLWTIDIEYPAPISSQCFLLTISHLITAMDEIIHQNLHPFGCLWLLQVNLFDKRGVEVEPIIIFLLPIGRAL